MSITSKRITATEPEKDLDTKAKIDQKVPSKSLSESNKPTETAVIDTAANSEKTQVAEIENQTKRLSIQDNEEEKVTTPSKKRHYEDISAEPEAKDASTSFNTALDGSLENSSKKSNKVSPDSKRLKMDDSPPKMPMDSEATVTEPEAKQEVVEEKVVEEIKPAETDGVKPADTEELKPTEEKASEVVPDIPSEAAAEVPVVPEEPKVAEAVTTADEAKPESKSMPAEEVAALTTPSVVKDIPASKLQFEAFAQVETDKPVSSTNTLEKEYQAEVTKQDDEQIQS